MTKLILEEGVFFLRSNKYTINTVKNAMTILKLFSVEKPEWSISEMARQLQFDISQTKRLVKILEKEDFLSRDPTTKRYHLGLSILTFCGIIISTMELHREAKPILEEVVKKLEEAVHLGILEGTDIVYLIKLDGPHPVRLVSNTGKKFPAYCTGCGKVILSYLNQKEQENLLNIYEKQGLIRFGPNTVRSVADLKAQLKEIREQGFAICIDELHEGVFTIAAPVFDYTEKAVAAISVTGPTHRLSPSKIPLYKQEITEAARKISTRLGYPSA